MNRRLFFAASLLLVVSGCAPRLQGDGVATVVERKLDAFATLEVAGPIAVEVEVDPHASPGMHLEADENLVSHVSWDLAGGALRIDAEGLSPVVPLRLKLRTTYLGDVSSSAGASVMVQKLKGARVALRAKDSSRLHAYAVDCDALVLEARGSSRVEASGQARVVEATAGEESAVVALAVDAKVALVLAEQLSTIHVSAREQVSGHAFGSSEVRVHGAPARTDIEGQPGQS
ncbi:MAG: hypothetical protein AMXMBFR34_18480 [Myxococcaceae bacterium]